jgi:hypothetical protein
MSETNKREYETASIENKIFKIQNEIGAISKDATNPFYKSKYADINSALQQLQPLFKKYGIVIKQPPKDGKVLTILTCVDTGQYVYSDLELPINDDPQKVGSTITYYRRYTLFGLLGLNTEDDDGNTASRVISKNKLSKSQYQATLKGTKEQAQKVLTNFDVTSEQQKGIKSKFNI